MTSNQLIKKVLAVLFVFVMTTAAGDFGAYYTKVNSGETFETYSRTGDYADIIVDLGDGSQFVFWRGSSYLPYLETNGEKIYVEEVIPRNGDGDKKRPDRVNLYSHVKIIESTPERVVVHWRYLPEFGRGNPHPGVSSRNFVDEYFFIEPDGQVTRTIKEGTEKIDAWRDPTNHITQKFSFTESGIEYESMTPAKISVEEKQVIGQPKITSTVISPVAWWKFDEGKGDNTVESVDETISGIAGHKSLWRNGVSGSALQFDGYNTIVSVSAEEAPKPKDAITLEGWMSVGAYPWSDVPLIQQADDVPEEIQSTVGAKAVLTSEDEEENDEEEGDFDFVLKKEDDTGYFFGLDGYGNPKFKLRVGDYWEELTADYHLERRVWYHLVATYSKDSGKMRIFVNGIPVAEKEVANATAIQLSKKDLKIGQGKKRRPIRPVRMNTFQDTYSFDGLIDEIRVYDKALTADQVNETFHLYDPNKGRRALVDMDERHLPAGEERDEFGAYYTHLDFYDVWDNLWRFSNHPDVVVEFDNNPSKFVFWRGVGYIPMIVNEKGQWYSNEFNETWNKSGGNGCQEPMSDKESYNNHARILESTPARTVVQWRFPLIDVNHVMANYEPETGWCDIADWYYYIYPDGIAVKTMHLWTHGERNHEWQESMAIFGPNQHPEQIIETRGAVTMMDIDGNYKTYDWVEGPPDDVDEPEGQVIQHINYTGEFDPITIGDFQWSNVYGGELTPYAVFPTWNHWPVAQMPSDGRYALFPDRTSHSSLTHVGPSIYDEVLDGPAPYYAKILLEGMLDQDGEELVTIAKSWMQAPKLSNLNGGEGEYDPAQRAYVIEKNSDNISFVLDASEDNPLYNASVVVNDWNSTEHAKLVIDGENRSSCKKVKQGIVRDTDGGYKLVLWIEKETTEKVDVMIGVSQ